MMFSLKSIVCLSLWATVLIRSSTGSSTDASDPLIALKPMRLKQTMPLRLCHQLRMQCPGVSVSVNFLLARQPSGCAFIWLLLIIESKAQNPWIVEFVKVVIQDRHKRLVVRNQLEFRLGSYFLNIPTRSSRNTIQLLIGIWSLLEPFVSSQRHFPVLEQIPSQKSGDASTCRAVGRFSS